jgi:hypothetical protein
MENDNEEEGQGSPVVIDLTTQQIVKIIVRTLLILFLQLEFAKETEIGEVKELEVIFESITIIDVSDCTNLTKLTCI